MEEVADQDGFEDVELLSDIVIAKWGQWGDSKDWESERGMSF